MAVWRLAIARPRFDSARGALARSDAGDLPDLPCARDSRMVGSHQAELCHSDRLARFGARTRAPSRAYAYRDIELTYDLLRADSNAEPQTIAGFYAEVAGRDGAFWFAPPGLSTLVGQAIGTGDGSTTVFALVAPAGGALEPVQATSGVSAIYLNGNPLVTGWSVSGGYLPAITFTTAPAANVGVSADFGLLWLCRFAEDVADLENFMTLLWSFKSVKLQTTRP